MKLPVPYKFNDKLLIDAEIKKPTTGTIAEAQDAAQKNAFSGMSEFVSGCLSALQSENGNYVDQGQLRNAVKEMPYIDAEYLALKSMALIAGDKIEGAYECPRCGNKIICEETEGYDARDSLSELNEIILDKEQTISIILETPIKLINRKDESILEEVNSIEMQIPTVRSCIQAANQANNEIKRQLIIYALSIISINGQPKSYSWINTWGNMILSQMVPSDTKKIGDFLNNIGIQKTKSRECKCGKKWEAALDLWNFFASGLR